MTPYFMNLVIKNARPETDEGKAPAAEPESKAASGVSSDSSSGAERVYSARWVEIDGQMSKPFDLELPLGREDHCGKGEMRRAF